MQSFREYLTENFSKFQKKVDLLGTKDISYKSYEEARKEEQEAKRMNLVHIGYDVYRKGKNGPKYKWSLKNHRFEEIKK
jgi:hypothetical protein